MTSTTSISAGLKLEPARQEQALSNFYREGYAIIPNVRTADEVELLRDLTDRFIDDPDIYKKFVTPIIKTNVLRSTQALHAAFAELLVHEPFISLAEAVLGPGVAFCGQNVIRSDEGTGISLWHVDDMLEFPLPDGIPRHDPRIKLPVF